MKVRSTKTALAFASVLGVMAALPLAARAETLLPGQAGADTSLGNALRADPYILMSISSSGMMTEREVMPKVATELMKHAKPLTGAMVLVHGGKAYLVEDMRMNNGKMLSDLISIPIDQIF
jgi:hypothetical protein